MTNISSVILSTDQLASVRTQLADLVPKRSACKARVTRYSDKLRDLIDNNTLTSKLFQVHKTCIEKSLDDVQSWDTKICNYLTDDPVAKLDFTILNTEIDKQSDYYLDVQNFLASCEPEDLSLINRSDLSVAGPSNNLPMPKLDAKVPALQCGNFSGEDDRLEFRTFLVQFRNLIDCKKNLSSSAKLTYLRGYLRGYALKVISYLEINDESYDIAMKLLKEEFLDIPHIKEQMFKKIVELYPKFDTSYQQTRVYINEIRSILHELENYGLDFLENDTAGFSLVSYIVFTKLPKNFQRELVYKVGSNYPTITDVFDHYNEIIRGLKRSSANKARVEENVSKQKSSEDSSKPTLYNFKTSLDNSNANRSSKPCKFCSVVGHGMWKCPKYSSLSARVSRCASLNLCELCTSSKHTKQDCPGTRGELSFQCNICSSKNHISAMCSHVSNSSPSTSTNVCLNFTREEDDKPFLLPTLTIKLKNGRSSCSVRCLLDSGSQRSYFSSKLMDKLDVTNTSRKIEFCIRSYLSKARKTLSENMLELSFFDSVVNIPVLFDPDFNIRIDVSHLGTAVTNLKAKGYRLADSGFCEAKNDPIQLDGLLGVDILQFFPDYQVHRCMNARAYSVPSGIIPFGNIEGFLYPNQIQEMCSPSFCSDNSSSETICTSESHVNFVLSPRQSYFDPMTLAFPESNVEHGVENLFSLEAVGLKDESDISSIDEPIMKKFEENLEFREGKYHVALPWYEDKICKVKSNHKIAIAVLDSVIRSLRARDILGSYQAVFDQQLADGIIEEIHVDPPNYGDYVWIPHRPVIKTTDQTTTKIRPVFNCSLKIDNTPSLNEAAFKGVDLMTDLLKLLLAFRTNSYAVISDIRQAFLMVMLKEEVDKNRFCFFMRDSLGNLHTYRYRTIVFGFTASPFCLNYILKYHAKQYPEDDVSRLLYGNLYVDNFLATSNNPEFLKQIYRESLHRMSEGGFELRSWNTNEPSLAKIMTEEGTKVTHDKPCEKVLGYEYYPSSDAMRLASVFLSEHASTKRAVLSEISKIFDPIGVYQPVTVRGRLLIREMWADKLEWDQPISEAHGEIWQRLFIDLSSLSVLEFPRNSISQENSSLVVFCDASRVVYGFAVYAVEQSHVNLIFAKSKVSPLKPRSLPTLELLAVFLALKCLDTLVSSYKSRCFSSITLCIDAQIVISWILSGNSKSKNLFTRNRIRDILAMVSQLKTKYDLQIHFKYVPSNENMADMLTRGLTLAEFKGNYEKWINGPHWLAQDPIQWPSGNLGCLSEVNKITILENSVESSTGNSANVFLVQTDRSSLFDFARFSKWTKLLGAVTKLFQFILNLKKSDRDPNLAAREFIIKTVQSESFYNEIRYLSNPNSDSDMPELVTQLALFLDESCILRSKGRINKTEYFDSQIKNPIVLPTKHHVTDLLIDDFHKRCKHLGLQTTLNLVRTNGFWIPSGRQSVKRVLSDCTTCKKFNSFSFSYPKMTDISKERMDLVKPFKHTGVDFSGALYVYEDGKSQKMYILLYTCLSVRAIHMDLLPDMSTASFLMSFLRFSNRYGVPTHIYSDNALSFIAGGTLLGKALQSNEFTEHLKLSNIKHVTIPVYSAWVGSCWERMIRVVKSCLFKVVGRVNLTYYQLLTVLSDIQNAVNSRPLTYRSSDSDLDTITPNNFLKLGDHSSLMFNDDDSANLWLPPSERRKMLESALDKREEAFERFKLLWYESYLLSLREQSADLHETDWENRIRVGDVVLLKLPNKSRPFWPLGRVTKLCAGDDGKVRSAELLRGDGKTYHHSICHLYPLELSWTHSTNMSNCNKDSPPKRKNPKRAAAEKCRQLMKDQIS